MKAALCICRVSETLKIYTKMAQERDALRVEHHSMCRQLEELLGKSGNDASVPDEVHICGLALHISCHSFSLSCDVYSAIWLCGCHAKCQTVMRDVCQSMCRALLSEFAAHDTVCRHWRRSWSGHVQRVVPASRLLTHQPFEYRSTPMSKSQGVAAVIMLASIVVHGLV